MATEARIEMPSFGDESKSLAGILGPESVREEVLAEEALSGGTAEALEAGPELKADGFKYEASLRGDGTRMVLEQVLNGGLSLEDVAANENVMQKLEEELVLVTHMKNLESTLPQGATLDRLIRGEVDMGGLDRTQLRRLSLSLGNLYSIPTSLANDMREWVLSDKRHEGAGDLQAKVAENFAARQAIDPRVNLLTRVGDSPVADALIGNKGIDMQAGPKQPEFDPKLESKITHMTPSGYSM